MSPLCNLLISGSGGGEHVLLALSHMKQLAFGIERCRNPGHDYRLFLRSGRARRVHQGQQGS